MKSLPIIIIFFSLLIMVAFNMGEKPRELTREEVRQAFNQRDSILVGITKKLDELQKSIKSKK